MPRLYLLTIGERTKKEASTIISPSVKYPNVQGDNEMAGTRREQKIIKALFGSLIDAKRKSFPRAGNAVDAPRRPGVYVIYGPAGRPLHVGCTPRANTRQRLQDHLCNRSSVTTKYLKGRGDRLRREGYTFCCYPIANPRRRVLLEAYAIGRLCPTHIGHGAGGARLKPK